MTNRRILRARLTRKMGLLEKAYETYDELLSDGVESYRFDSGDGSQQTKKRNLNELKTQIDKLESEVDSICRQLDRKGLTNIALRRSSCNRLF